MRRAGGQRGPSSRSSNRFGHANARSLPPLSLCRFNQVLNTSIVAHLESIPSTSRESYSEMEKEREEREERRGEKLDAFLASRLLSLGSSRSFLFPHLPLNVGSNASAFSE